MEKEYLERMIEEGNSLNKIAKESGRGLTIVRYWVRKYGLKSKYSPYNENSIKEYGTHRICPKCKRMVETENFNDRRGKKNSSVYCKTCTTIQTVDRVRKMKELMVEYTGFSKAILAIGASSRSLTNSKASACSFCLNLNHREPLTAR